MEFFKLSRLNLINLLVLTAMLNACAMFDPFVDRRREAGAKDKETLYVGESKPEAPAICYNRLRSKFEDVQKMADNECIKQKTGTHAEPVKETIFTCRVLIPNHYYFKCVE